MVPINRSRSIIWRASEASAEKLFGYQKGPWTAAVNGSGSKVSQARPVIKEQNAYSPPVPRVVRQSHGMVEE